MPRILAACAAASSVRGELHAAGLATPAGVYLGFDDDAAAAEA